MNSSGTLHEITHAIGAAAQLVIVGRGLEIARVECHIDHEEIAFAHDDATVRATCYAGGACGPLALIPGDDAQVASMIARGLHDVELSPSDLEHARTLRHDEQFVIAMAVRNFMRERGAQRVERLCAIVEGDEVMGFGVPLRLSSIAPYEAMRDRALDARKSLPRFGAILVRAAA